MKLKQGMRKRIRIVKNVYEPTFASDEAKICLNCTKTKCNGDCAEIRKKCKELKNGKNTQN